MATSLEASQSNQHTMHECHDLCEDDSNTRQAAETTSPGKSCCANLFFSDRNGWLSNVWKANSK